MSRTPTKQNAKAVTYRRASTPRQGESKLGLTAQKRIVYQYCKANHITLVKEFVEIKSGTNGKRPKVQQAIKYCRQHGLLLIVATQSRLARSVSFIAALTDSDFPFISVENPAASKLQKHVQAAFDQQVAEDTSRNTKNSLESAAKKGIRLGGNSKKRLKTMRRKKKTFLKKMRPIIQRMKRRGITTQRDILGELNRRKIRTYHKKTGWHVSTVHQLLHELKTKNK